MNNSISNQDQESLNKINDEARKAIHSFFMNVEGLKGASENIGLLMSVFAEKNAWTDECLKETINNMGDLNTFLVILSDNIKEENILDRISDFFGFIGTLSKTIDTLG